MPCKPSCKTAHKPLEPVQPELPWPAPTLVAGVDEAGRGPLAGPVVAAAVILNPLHPIAGLADSKQLSARQRERLDAQIRAHALCVALGQASVAEIDQLNILQATLLAMRRAVDGLRLMPDLVQVDGNQLPRLPMRAQAIVGGDRLVAAISAASIVAKVARDQYCAELHARWPDYGFDRHKGYGTAAHLLALQRLGPSPAHRRSFAPVARALAQAQTAAQPPAAAQALAQPPWAD